MPPVEVNQIMELLRDMAKDLEELKQQAIRAESKQDKCEKVFQTVFVTKKEFPYLWECERRSDFKHKTTYLTVFYTFLVLLILFRDNIFALLVR
jgi:preprotein translocase subunit SecY